MFVFMICGKVTSQIRGFAMNRTLIRRSVLALVLALVPEYAIAFAEPGNLPTLKQAIASKQDLFGQLAMSQPNGPSYEF